MWYYYKCQANSTQISLNGTLSNRCTSKYRAANNQHPSVMWCKNNSTRNTLATSSKMYCAWTAAPLYRWWSSTGIPFSISNKVSRSSDLNYLSIKDHDRCLRSRSKNVSGWYVTILTVDPLILVRSSVVRGAPSWGPNLLINSARYLTFRFWCNRLSLIKDFSSMGIPLSLHSLLSCYLDISRRCS